jgi:hypothetical protein
MEVFYAMAVLWLLKSIAVICSVSEVSENIQIMEEGNRGSVNPLSKEGGNGTA